MKFANHRQYAAADEFSRLSMELRGVVPRSLSDENVKRYDYTGRQLLTLARLTGEESHISLARSEFGRVHRELIRRELQQRAQKGRSSHGGA